MEGRRAVDAAVVEALRTAVRLLFVEETLGVDEGPVVPGWVAVVLQEDALVAGGTLEPLHFTTANPDLTPPSWS